MHDENIQSITKQRHGIYNKVQKRIYLEMTTSDMEVAHKMVQGETQNDKMPFSDDKIFVNFNHLYINIIKM